MLIPFLSLLLIILKLSTVYACFVPRAKNVYRKNICRVALGLKGVLACTMKKFSDQIIGYLEEFDKRPVKVSRMARALGIGAEEYGDFRETVDALRRVGRVIMGSNDALSLPHPGFHVVGTYRANPRGFGFVIPDDVQVHGDLYIGKGNALDAVTGDKVLCEILSRRVSEGEHRIKAEIVTVLERANSRFVGQLHKDGKYWCVMPDGNMLHVPILIGDPHARNAVEGDQVVVEITRYPSEGHRARGVIVERLGAADDPDVDRLSVIRAFHLPEVFPEDAMREARDCARAFSPESPAEGREDLTGKLVITIDPEQARDFDDAISLEVISKKGHKKWELGVHIADVSHFVPAGGALDAEAVKRGTSVYLPGYVIPMLPEVLSNELCSLQEGVPRLAKSVFIRYDEAGVPESVRYCNSVIQSDARLTYEQATEILEGRGTQFPKRIQGLVKDMERLARVIRKRRLSQGMLVLNLPDVELVLDDQGGIKEARPEDQSFSHTLIEMFMVEANEAVAHLFDYLRVPCLRRIHPAPAQEAMEKIGVFFAALGIPVGRRAGTLDVQRSLLDIEGSPRAYAANLFVLQSLKTAEYAPQPIGHFALASQAYLHFTSPIRRYPDLMAHRLLDHWLTTGWAAAPPPPKGWMRYPAVGKKKGRKKEAFLSGEGIVPLEELGAGGQDMSYKARRAEAAERDLKAVKILKLLKQQEGEEFTGIITGVAQFGLFVQHPVYLFDGLIRIENLGDDWWEVYPEKGRIQGVRSSRVFKLGEPIDVRIESVDISLRQVSLVARETESKKHKKDKPPSKTPKKHMPSGKKRMRKQKTKKKSRK
ncbi:MAG: VacB/RNase II family 3'-5' exoribonuclease [Spartobacteria bacterium]|nr:VacB/RNase II family 3'-5' exoribonuclease [Spartobacteria bacterium]